MSKRIFVPLATDPFADFAQGCKTVEIRNLDSPVAKQVLADPTPGRRVLLRRGYNTPNELHGRLGRIEMVASAKHFSQWVRDGAAVNFEAKSRFFDASAKLLAIEVLPAWDDNRPEGGAS